MSYQDEELLRMRQKAAEFRKQQISDDTIHDELKQSIYDSVTYITKIPVVFEDKALVDGRLTMRAPKDFEPLPDAVIKQQFIMENRPQYVYKIPYLPFSATFTVTEIPGDETYIEQMFPYIVRTVKTVGPNVRVLSTGKKVVHGIYVRWFETIAQTITEPSYRTVFIFALDEMTTIGCITCPSRLKKRYQPIMQEMVESLQILDKSVGEGS